MKFSRDLLWPAILFLLAVAIRMPSCYESFWVDELHSAWCVWDSLGDVASRASVGNQSPVWFWGLWVWKQVVGDSELALRTLSVLCTAGSASVLCFAISRKFSSAAGIAAGCVLALEINALFFGTELRPYSAVILLASLAVASLLSDPRRVFSIAILTAMAVAVQPTSLVVMSGMLLLAIAKQRRGGQEIQRRDLAAIGGLLAVIGLVGWFVLLPTWAVRDRWGAFAVAPSFGVACSIWSWTWLWILPLVGIWKSRRLPRWELTLLAGLCVAVVLGFWAISRLDFVHLWHRRYFIGLLPIFATLVGASVCSTSMNRWLEGLLAGGFVFGLVVSQQTATQFVRDPSRLAYRGEGWRDAIAAVEGWDAREVQIDSGLIEAKSYLSGSGEISPLKRDYLLCVALGPYQLKGSTLIPVSGPTGRDVVTVSRGRPSRDAGEITQFGRVWVTRQE